MDNKNQNLELALHDATGALLMLNKYERKLLKELLTMTLKSNSAKEWIIKKLGQQYDPFNEEINREQIAIFYKKLSF